MQMWMVAHVLIDLHAHMIKSFLFVKCHIPILFAHYKNIYNDYSNNDIITIWIV